MVTIQDCPDPKNLDAVEGNLPKKYSLELMAIFDAGEDSEFAEVVRMEDLRKLLSARIGWLLDHKPEQFFSMIYRIDVPEASVREAIAGLKGNDVAYIIAGLVIERFQEKLRYRKLYSP